MNFVRLGLLGILFEKDALTCPRTVLQYSNAMLIAPFILNLLMVMRLLRGRVLVDELSGCNLMQIFELGRGA